MEGMSGCSQWVKFGKRLVPEQNPGRLSHAKVSEGFMACGLAYEYSFQRG